MLSVILCFSTVGTSELFGVNVEYVGKLNVSAKPALLMPWSFCVTEDGLFIIPDKEAGDIKIYEKVGETLEYIKTIGRKGFGPGELVYPAYCSYNKKESKFLVMDIGQRKIFVYDRIGRTDFKRDKEIYCLRLGEDVQLIDGSDKLIISGYKESPQGIAHELYSTNIKDGSLDFLLPSYHKYGLALGDENKEDSLKRALGVRGWFDVQGEDIYFVWEGDLRITKLNINTKTTQVFGPKVSTKYKSPADIVDTLLDIRSQGKFHQYSSEKSRRSFVRNIFTRSEYLFVVYEGPGKSKFFLQFYTLNGDFIKEVPISHQPDRRMWFDKDKGILYSLADNTNENKNDYFILKYKIQ